MSYVLFDVVISESKRSTHVLCISILPMYNYRDGATYSGLLAASIHVRGRLETDRDVDITHSVRSVAATRHQFIHSMVCVLLTIILSLYTTVRC